VGRGLWTTYDVHLGLIGEPVEDFLVVLIELFLLVLRQFILHRTFIFFTAFMRNSGLRSVKLKQLPLDLRGLREKRCHFIFCHNYAKF